MEQRIFHGDISPSDVAQALLAYFNRGNLRTQTIGNGDNLTVQIATRPGAMSGGQTALTVAIKKTSDGILVAIGEQSWFGVAASLGQTAFSVLTNPLSLLGRLDDIAQDMENLQLAESVWQIIGKTAQEIGATHELSEKLRRLECEFCGTANPVGESNCIACGAPLGNIQPRTCKNCGYVAAKNESVCPNCGFKI
jgi:hypothetical protein